MNGGIEPPRPGGSRWLDILTAVRGDDAALGVRICQQADAMLGFEASALSLIMDHTFSLIAASDDLATVLEEEQFSLGEGPSFEGAAANLPICVADLWDAPSLDRWPGFTRFAERVGARSVFTFPLRIGEARIGVLSGYRRSAGALPEQAYADGITLASVAASLLLDQQVGGTAESLAEAFRPGVLNQAEVQQAAGMVAEQLGISVVAGLVRLRAAAFRLDRPLSVVARQVVNREFVIKAEEQ